MTALGQNTARYWHPAFAKGTRRTPGIILRGARLYQGSLAFLHDDGTNGARLMPAQFLNNANLPAAGGPLQVAGADGNGGLRFIARRPNVKIGIATSGTGTDIVAPVTVSYGASVSIAFTVGSNTTALIFREEAMANAEVRSLLDIGFTGTGASVMGTVASSTKVPFVRIAGVMKEGFDNSGNASADLVVTDRIVDVNTGCVSMVNDTTDPASAADVGGLVTVLDDLTIARTAFPLQLDVELFDWGPAGGGSTTGSAQLLPYILIP
jgi:hypothetical protein